jgi:hypothetical protein
MISHAETTKLVIIFPFYIVELYFLHLFLIIITQNSFASKYTFAGTLMLNFSLRIKT